MNKVIILILALFVLASCHDAGIYSLKLDSFKKFDVTDEHLSIRLIKSYQNQSYCNDLTINANTYFCETTKTKDTILVFDCCNEMPDFAKHTFFGERDLIIDKKDVVNGSFKEIFVSTNDAKILNKKYKYVLANLTSLNY